MIDAELAPEFPDLKYYLESGEIVDWQTPEIRRLPEATSKT